MKELKLGSFKKPLFIKIQNQRIRLSLISEYKLYSNSEFTDSTHYRLKINDYDFIGFDRSERKEALAVVSKLDECLNCEDLNKNNKYY